MEPKDYVVAQDTYKEKLAMEAAQDRAIDDYLVEVLYAEHINLDEFAID